MQCTRKKMQYKRKRFDKGVLPSTVQFSIPSIDNDTQEATKDPHRLNTKPQFLQLTPMILDSQGKNQAHPVVETEMALIFEVYMLL